MFYGAIRILGLEKSLVNRDIDKIEHSELTSVENLLQATHRINNNRGSSGIFIAKSSEC